MCCNSELTSAMLVSVAAALGAEVAFTARKVLAVSLQERIKLNVAREVLRDTRHNGFPVVRNTPHGQVGRLST